MDGPAGTAAAFPLGAAVTLAELDGDPHPALARLRAAEPVSWVPALGAWLVTRRDLALAAMRDDATFTVDDARFSTGRVVGPSMLSLDGAAHARHRAPFARPFRLDAVRRRFADVVGPETDALLDAVEPDGGADLRRALCGPLAVRSMVHALGLQHVEVGLLLRWYEDIVAAVTAITAGEALPEAGRTAVERLRAAVTEVLPRDPASSLLAAAAHDAEGLDDAAVVANAAVLLFGGIETTDGMIANAVLHLLSAPEQLELVRADPALVAAAVEESLRLEPAAAVVDRYATRDVTLGGAPIRGGDLVTVSLAGANRDPDVWSAPDRFDVRRPDLRLHVAFAQGPHVCLGMHLARLEAHAALTRLLARFPRLRLDPARPTAPRGLVFRKPPALHVRWD